MPAESAVPPGRGAARRRARVAAIALGVALAVVGAGLAPGASVAGVISQSDVAPVWSVHATGAPVLLTTASFQYVAYYDRDLYLTVAQRPVDGSAWTYRRFAEVRSNWQTLSHHLIAMQVDTNGMVHLAAAMHVEGLRYFRMTVPNDLASFQRFTTLVGTSGGGTDLGGTDLGGTDEDRISYPAFLRGADGTLFLTYRAGGSGNAFNLINRYDASTRAWSRLVPRLLDGTATDQSAYLSGPVLGPDGRFHLTWVWRVSPDIATNYRVSYASSANLVDWTSASGAAVSLPITPASAGLVVDDVPQKGGLYGGFTLIGFDSVDRPVITYPKYDPAGNTQLYSARFDGSEWHVVKGTRWPYRWNLVGRGARPIDLTFSPAAVTSGSRLAVDFTHVKFGGGRLLLDEATLAPVGIGYAGATPQLWPQSLAKPRSVNPPRPMTVDFIRDVGTAAATSTWVLRWEHGPINNDSAVRKPWPAPTMLRVVRLNPSTERYTSGNLARGRPVTASSSREGSGWGRSRVVDGTIFAATAARGFASARSTGVDHPEWVQVDLGRVRSVNQVSLFPAYADGHGMPRTYAVRVSRDGARWVTVATLDDEPLAAGQQTVGFGSVSARFVRVSARALRPNPHEAGEYRLQLAEIRVLGRGGR